MIFRDLKLPFREFTHKKKKTLDARNGRENMPPKKKDKAAASGEGDTGEEVFLANYKKAAKIFGGEEYEILMVFREGRMVGVKRTTPRSA